MVPRGMGGTWSGRATGAPWRVTWCRCLGENVNWVRNVRAAGARRCCALGAGSPCSSSTSPRIVGRRFGVNTWRMRRDPVHTSRSTVIPTREVERPTLVRCPLIASANRDTDHPPTPGRRRATYGSGDGGVATASGQYLAFGARRSPRGAPSQPVPSLPGARFEAEPPPVISDPEAIGENARSKSNPSAWRPRRDPVPHRCRQALSASTPCPLFAPSKHGYELVASACAWLMRAWA